jgi:hypothetical protein
MIPSSRYQYSIYSHMITYQITRYIYSIVRGEHL